MPATTIRLSAVETIQVERTGQTVKLTVCVGGAPILSKHIPALAAVQIGDALGYAGNDIARPTADDWTPERCEHGTRWEHRCVECKA